MGKYRVSTKLSREWKFVPEQERVTIRKKVYQVLGSIMTDEDGGDTGAGSWTPRAYFDPEKDQVVHFVDFDWRTT